MFTVPRVLLCLALLAPAAPTLAQPAFYLHSGDRVVFYGGSITDQRLYTSVVETYVVTRFPLLDVRFIAAGSGSDDAGDSDHSSDARLQRDVIDFKPTVLTILPCAADDGVHPFDPAQFNAFARRLESVVDEVQTALPDTRITLIQPPPYDDVTRTPAIAGGFNGVMLDCGALVRNLAERKGLTVVDFNRPLVDVLKAAQLRNPQLARRIVPDRVHPGVGGSLVLAAALLEAWGAPALVSSVEIDAGAKQIATADNARVADLKFGSRVSWTEQDDALPLPIRTHDPVVQLVLDSSDLIEQMDREMLTVRGLPSPHYRLEIDGQEIGLFTREQLAGGINLAPLETPMERQAEEVLKATVDHNNLHYERWRNIHIPVTAHFGNHGEMADDRREIGDQQTLTSRELEVESAMTSLEEGLAAEEDDVVRRQRQLAQPVPHAFSLTPCDPAIP